MKLNEDSIRQLEKLRADAYGFDSQQSFAMDFANTYYAQEMKRGKYLVYGSFFQSELVAGCYISDAFHSLFIEQLFVKKCYQETGLYIGRNLLRYILQNKFVFEEFFQMQFFYSKLSPSSQKSTLIYEKMGYSESSSELGLFRKRI